MRTALLMVPLVVAAAAAVLTFRSGTEEPGDRAPRPEPPVPADRVPAALPEGEEAHASESEVARVEGRVVAAGAAPVAGARIAAYTPGLFPPMLLRWEPPPPAASAETDAEGRFALDLPKGTKWLYCVDAPGTMRVWTGDPRRVRLNPGRGVRTVRVMDEVGLPLPDATAVLYRFHLDGPPLCEPIRADRDGVLEVRWSSGLDLLIRAPGYVSGWLSNAPWRREIRLKPGAVIAGTVVTSDRRAIPGAEVRLKHHNGVQPDDVTVTDEHSSFRFDGMARRKHHYTLVAAHAGYSTRTWNVKAGDETVELPLYRPGAIAGTVTLPDGAPAAGAKVASVHADEEGRFRIESVPAGSHTLQVTAGLLPGLPKDFDYVPRYVAAQPVTVREGEAAEDVNITLREEVYSYVVLKLLRHSGEPESEMHFWRCDEGERRYSGDAKDGRYLLVFAAPPGTRVSFGLTDASLGSSLSYVWTPLEADKKFGLDLAAVTSARPDAPEQVVKLARPARIDVRVLTKEGTEFPPGAKLMVTMNGHLLNHHEGSEGYGYVHPDRPLTIRVDLDGREVALSKLPAPGGDKTVEVRAR